MIPFVLQSLFVTVTPLPHIQILGRGQTDFGKGDSSYGWQRRKVTEARGKATEGLLGLKGARWTVGDKKRVANTVSLLTDHTHYMFDIYITDRTYEIYLTMQGCIS